MKPWRKLWREETKSFSSLPFFTRATAAMLLKVADDDGVLCKANDCERFLRNYLRVTPVERRGFNKALDELLASGYTAILGDDLVIAKFDAWQNDAKPRQGRATHERHTPSTPPTDAEQTDDVSATDGRQTDDIESHVSQRNLWGGEEQIKSQSQSQSQNKDKDSSCPAPETVASPTVLVFPCQGAKKTWNLTEAHVAEWSALFPSLSILDECRHALAWVNAEKSKRKTARGMPRYLVGWFTRSVNRGQQRTGPVRTGTPAPMYRTLGPS